MQPIPMQSISTTYAEMVENYKAIEKAVNPEIQRLSTCLGAFKAAKLVRALENLHLMIKIAGAESESKRDHILKGRVGSVDVESISPNKLNTIEKMLKASLRLWEHTESYENDEGDQVGHNFSGWVSQNSLEEALNDFRWVFSSHKETTALANVKRQLGLT